MNGRRPFRDNERAASFAAWMVLALAIVGLFYRHELFARGPFLIGIQVLAALLWGWARLAFGRRSFHGTAAPTQGSLVTRGPYRWLRHPIYASLLYFIGAGVASHVSFASVAMGGLAAAAVAIRIVAEEGLLVEQYPDYPAYRERTKLLIPFLF